MPRPRNRVDKENVSMSRTLKFEIRTMVFIAGYHQVHHYCTETLLSHLLPWTESWHMGRLSSLKRYRQGRNGDAVIHSKKTRRGNWSYLLPFNFYLIHTFLPLLFSLVSAPAKDDASKHLILDVSYLINLCHTQN